MSPENHKQLDLFYINPTSDYPLYGRADPWRHFSPKQREEFLLGLDSIGVDSRTFDHSNEISWDDAITIGDEIKSNLHRLNQGERKRNPWQRIEREFRCSRGIRIVTEDQKPLEVAPYIR
jgi:hypothetical protein